MPLTASTLSAVLIAVACLFGATPSACGGPTTAPGVPLVDITIGEELFRLRLAADGESRRRGLMGVEKIDEHGGMIFIFPRTRNRTFWMADCLIDIDVVFLDDQGRITAVHEMKREPARGATESTFRYHRRLKRFPSVRPARFALEFRAGTARRLGLEPGKTVSFRREPLLRLAR